MDENRAEKAVIAKGFRVLFQTLSGKLQTHDHISPVVEYKDEKGVIEIVMQEGNVWRFEKSCVLHTLLYPV